MLMWQSWVNGSIGLWLIVSAFLSLSFPEALLNNVIVGGILVLVGWSMRSYKKSFGWFAVIMGTWMVVCVTFPSFLRGSGCTWNDIVCGLIISVSGFTSLRGGIVGSEGTPMMR